MADLYAWITALHIVAVISWMAGLLYLPRLYVYHTKVTPGSEASETFKVMEAKLLGVIMTPAMIVAWGAGLALLYLGDLGYWIHLKLVFVLGLSGVHGFLSKVRRDFERDENSRPEKFFRIINEVPTVIMVVVVVLVVLKPF